MTRQGRLLMLAAVAIAVAAGGTGVWLASGGRDGGDHVAGGPDDRPSARPAGTSTFVGTAACAGCHSDVAEAHARSGHADTLATTQDSTIARMLDGKSFRDEARNLTFRYRHGPDGLSVTVPEAFGDKAFPLQYALGSGMHAVSFLTLIPGADGGTVGVEHRVSWFAATDGLALTPGHTGLGVEKEVELFGRFIRGEVLDKCVGCHATTSVVADLDIHDLRPDVGCESCHGPGSAHVEAASRGEAAGPIEELNPRHWSADREIEMCGRCHRSPSDVKPEELVPGRASLVRFAPVGLRQSACFKASDGALRCATCHDPHEPATSRTTRQYEAKCVDCHTPHRAGSVPCPVSPAQGCVRCHLPPIEVHPGLVFHDHWIRVRGENDPAPFAAVADHAADPAVEEDAEENR